MVGCCKVLRGTDESIEGGEAVKVFSESLAGWLGKGGGGGGAGVLTVESSTTIGLERVGKGLFLALENLTATLVDLRILSGLNLEVGRGSRLFGPRVT